MTETKETKCSTHTEGFECNICFETAKEPVVTVCGHLFCWGCLYRWIDRQPECPVCKAGCDRSNIIPLYGKGTAKPADQRNDIPRRPTGQRPHNNTEQEREQRRGGGGGQTRFEFFGFPFFGLPMASFQWPPPNPPPAAAAAAAQPSPPPPPPPSDAEADAERRGKVFLFIGITLLTFITCFPGSLVL
eukprot:NODE_1545_length_856_cov_182.416357_g1199_i0.p1 GENE.NODE_1545_length_856_cov_182.416357_g1199_i0~~NODE_1545_length_856_cov_182.416357_g1199_i0.p1  ORF type:complete len:209 (-),score=60.04 NODE_1545_length_856_cov_182.416357_g1199_i0:229-792(-)